MRDGMGQIGVRRERKTSGGGENIRRLFFLWDTAAKRASIPFHFLNKEEVVVVAEKL